MGFGTEGGSKFFQCKVLCEDRRVGPTLELGNWALTRSRKLKIVACIMSFSLSLEFVGKFVFVVLVATGGIEPPTLGL